MCAKVLYALLLLLLGEHAFAGPRTVKVGFFANAGYHEISENGEKGGYGYDLLRQMSRYANLNFELVGYEKKWDDMVKMLDRGEIDLVSPADRTQNLETYLHIRCLLGEIRVASLCANRIRYCLQK